MKGERSAGRIQQGRQLAALGLALILAACGQADVAAGPGNDNATLLTDNGADPLSNIELAVVDMAPAPPPPPPPCAAPPANGAVLEGDRPSGEGHELVIRNGTRGDAIIKIRNADTGGLVTSFFVVQNDHASVSGLPDGRYYFQYAFGTLAQDCRSFATISSANRFPDSESFVTEEIETPDGPRLRRSRLSFTLFPVDEGNVEPTPIDPGEFNR